jgi:carboxypeptidase C (cathepsin A)
MKRLAACALALLLALPAQAQLLPGQEPPTAEVAPEPAPPGPARPAAAERPGPAEPAGAPGQRRAAPASEGRRLPPNATTEHRLELPGRTLAFSATAGAIHLVDREGRLEAEIGFVAYALKDRDPAGRPVTFALNGGPGAASAYLHLGVLGPWRLPLGGATLPPSTAPVAVPNGETWLDFTDLVFIDPVGTGFSRLAQPGDELRRRYLSVEGDVAALSDAINRWLVENGRLTSPKFFVGESYGGFRGPLLAEKMQTDHGIGLSGLVLLSPVLDFGWRTGRGHAPLPRVSLLPSLAAAALDKDGAVTREALAEVERYAAGEYVTDLLRGLQDKEAVARINRRVAELTGLDPEIVRRQSGRLDMRTAQRELFRAEGRIASAYDTGVTIVDPDPTAAFPRFPDPILDGMTAPLTGAAVDLLARKLNWRPEGRYVLLNGGVSGAWNWGRGRGAPEVVSALARALALDAHMRVLVTHGFTDLVTPYFESELILRQLPDFGRRVALEVYPGGHMYYSRDASREAFRRDGERLYASALAARAGNPAATR